MGGQNSCFSLKLNISKKNRFINYRVSGYTYFYYMISLGYPNQSNEATIKYFSLAPTAPWNLKRRLF